MDTNYSPTFEQAHPKAKLLMNEEFFFSVTEDTAPFGSGDGADAYVGFRNWRAVNSTENPIEFLHAQIQNLGYPPFDVMETSFEKLAPYLNQDDAGFDYITGIDAAIVAIALGQLYLEGKIEPKLKELAKTAITRELLPDMLEEWKENAPIRELKLEKLMNVLDGAE
jgi:uncharacterized protein YfeS